MGPSRLAWMHLILWPFTISSSFSPIFTSCLKRPCTVSYLAALLPKTFEQRQNWQERGKTGKREREFFAATRCGVELHSKALIAAKIGSDPRRAKKLSRHQNPNQKDINPALQPNSRFQGSKVTMLSGKIPRFCRVPRFHSCRFPGLQGCRFPEFQGSRVLNYHGSGAPSFQGSKFQGSRLVRVLV